MAEADPKFPVEAAAEPAAKTWLDYIQDGREWALSKASSPMTPASLEGHARAYADVSAPAAVKAAHFAAAKAARDLEFAR